MKKITIIRKKGERRPKAASLRARKAAAIYIAGGVSKAEAMRQAGYTATTANIPSRIFDSSGVKEIMEPVLENYRSAQSKVVKAMAEMPMKRLKRTGMMVLSMAAKNITHDTQLLSGMATDRTHVLAADEEEEIRNAFKANLKK